MINLKNKRLKGNRIYLKILEEKNATQEYYGWLNAPEVNKYLETREASIADLKQYVKEEKRIQIAYFWEFFLKKIINILGT